MILCFRLFFFSYDTVSSKLAQRTRKKATSLFATFIVWIWNLFLLLWNKNKRTVQTSISSSCFFFFASFVLLVFCVIIIHLLLLYLCFQLCNAYMNDLFAYISVSFEVLLHANEAKIVCNKPFSSIASIHFIFAWDTSAYF